ncbi:MAG: hypothetical protein EXX96DRAFT_583262 [Benjaminiella poitrasii]|nr:MAG: hypothetical protein EXX96DRAFT_583262 [Benjaminiella poitrasii]
MVVILLLLIYIFIFALLLFYLIMSSQSLPTSFKQSSNLRVNDGLDYYSSSPLSKQHFFSILLDDNSNEAVMLINTTESNSGTINTTSDKSWHASSSQQRHWSMPSSAQRPRNKWIEKHKDKSQQCTFSSIPDSLRLEEGKSYGKDSQGKRLFSLLKNSHKKRRSLADVLHTFYRHNNSTVEIKSSKRLGKVSKRKKGKQPYYKKSAPLDVNTATLATQQSSVSHRRPLSSFLLPPTISSKNSSTGVLDKFPTPPERFSAYYINSEGQFGKTRYENKSMPLFHWILLHLNRTQVTTKYVFTEQQVMMDIKEDAEIYHNHQFRLYSILFTLGFIFFPCWWFGAWLYYFHNYTDEDDDRGKLGLFSIRTLAYLNGIFSCLSFIIIIVIISFIIWMAKCY